MTTLAPGGAGQSIRTLPPLLVNQIAAGEVVERPASVVKELVDNALDAGASRITVELETGGIELIRVTDDGRGISAAELPLAPAPHATSKIAAPEDLDRIATMGFRGEALASITSVARFSIRSRTGADAGASTLDAEGETVGPVRPAPGPVGTSVTVRNLFFNTPARRKFLRTPTTEQGHCRDIVESLAMSHPAVGFTLTADGRTLVDLPPNHSPRERIVAILGKELESQLIEVHADHLDDSRGVALWGMAGLPTLARATAKSQYTFLNGRPIRDKTVQHAVREAYRGLIEPGRFPTIVLLLEMNPGAVDVNVHPQKLEVRFRDSSLVHSTILRAVRDALRAADLTPAINSHGYSPRFGEDRAILPGSGSSGSGGASDLTGPAVQPGATPGFAEYFKRVLPGATGERLSYSAIREAIENTPLAPPSPTDTTESPAAPAESPSAPLEAPRPADRVMQVHKSFVVTQDEQGLVIVDQHALHERVMFEELIYRITSPGESGGLGGLESQRMLVPEVVEATALQIERLPDLAPLLHRLGIELSPMGPSTVAVQAFPTFLFDRNVEPAPFIRELLEKAESSAFVPGSEETLHEVLDMMACKAAVKAGDKMTESELLHLLKLRETVERASNCPHGRPTSIRLTIRELEKRFGRS
jgi:DNA mismatch repair protein MutL